MQESAFHSPGPLFAALRVEGPEDLRPGSQAGAGEHPEGPRRERSKIRSAAERARGPRPDVSTGRDAAASRGRRSGPPRGASSSPETPSARASAGGSPGAPGSHATVCPAEPSPKGPPRSAAGPGVRGAAGGLAAAAAELAAFAAPTVGAAPGRAAPPPAEPEGLEASLRRLFGFESFRPGQREVIEAVLAGRDALAVLPTGGGKSLTYLLPAYLLPGVTVVVSPLISLMQDQAAKLKARGLAATVINSQVAWAQQRERLHRLRDGEVQVLFVAPERFRNARFMEALAGARVSLLAIDEAHCVSQWGHDFRPDYLRLDEAAHACGRPPVLAVTATATAQVRADIARELGLRADHLSLVAGFDRPNLHLGVRVLSGGRQVKLRALHALLRRVPGGEGGGRVPGLIYCATRRNCDQVARALRAAGHGRVGVYHAGRSDDVRQRVQERFFDGKVDVVVATNAFGLGIDKQDLRFVLHHDLPGSVEAYYQEAGRAGRDGQPAACALLFAPQDIHLQRFFIRTAHPEAAVVRAVARAQRRVGSDPAKIERALTDGVNGRAIEAALRLLERAGGDVAAIDFEAVRARAAHQEALLQALLGYAYGRGCRRQTILDYFGAPPLGGPCGNCDACCPAAGGAASERAPVAGPRTSPKKKTKATKKTTRKKTTTKAPAAPRPEPDDVDGQLLDALRALRKKLAKRRRLAPFKVFHDRTLEALAAERPRTRKGLLAVYGLGEKKVAKYGDQLLEVLKTWA